MKKTLLIFMILSSIKAFAQDEAVLIESDASFVLSGNVVLVLEDISLTNEGNADFSTGEIILDASSTRTISTTASLGVASLSTGNNTGSIAAEGEFEITDFTLASSDEITFSDTSSLTLSGIVSNPGNLIMQSGSSLYINTSSTGIGSITVERTTTFDENTGKYSVVSSPVENASFDILGTNAQNWIFEYLESEAYGTDASAKFSVPTETQMTVGKGYFSAFTGDSNGTITFTGVPNYANVNYPITYTDNVGDDLDKEGFNLIGNPFTCPVDFDTFISNSNNLNLLEEQTIWIWDDIASDTGGGSNLDYISVNVLGTSSVDSQNGGLSSWDGTINVGQGFFIKASTSGNIRFNQGMKTLEGNDDASYFRSTQIEKYWFGISNERNEFGSSTLIGFVSGASNTIDSYDASRFGQGFAIYTIAEGKKLAIQGMSDQWSSDDVNAPIPISLGYNIKEAGTYQISLRDLENTSLSSLYLIDNLNGESTNILFDTYTFQSEAGSFNNRFILSSSPFGDEQVLTTDKSLDIKVWALDNEILIRSDFEGHYKIWSSNGSVLDEGIFLGGTTQIDIHQNGIYIVAIESNEGISTYKVSNVR